MSRKMVDCRDVPNDIGCTLAISGEEDEVMEAAVAHAVQVHGDEDTPELREMIRHGMKNEPANIAATGAGKPAGGAPRRATP